MKEKHILIILNYYYPYVSGVSEYAKIEAEELARRGYKVWVLAANHNHLPEMEYINGVKVTRAPIWFKISKGVISPRFLSLSLKLSKWADIIHLHLPMLESGPLSLLLPQEKIFSTYQCDINLPKGIFNNFIVKTMDVSHSLCMKHSNMIFTTTLDYAQHSRLLKKHLSKVKEAYAPVKEYKRQEVEKGNKKIIGFCGRIVEEKGLDILLKAYEIIRKKRSDIELIIAGNYNSVMGGGIYPQLKAYIKDHKISDVKFLGEIPEEKMSKFYSMLDVFVLPSKNSLEAFGMVQLEAMYCGTPVVASDLYGVRTIVQNTGMGCLHHAGNAADLAQALLTVLDNPAIYRKERQEIAAIYGTKCVVDRYERVWFGNENRKNS